MELELKEIEFVWREESSDTFTFTTNLKFNSIELTNITNITMK